MRTLFPSHSLFNELSHLFEGSYRTQSHQLFATEDGWALRVDLPGFKKSEVDLKFEDKALLLKAEKGESSDSRREPVEHRFALGEEVDTPSISATLENGVLEIALPRKDAVESSQQIIIQ